MASTDLQPGDQLLAARLVSKEEVSDDVKDKVQISTLLAAERAVGGSLKKGDLVGVYLRSIRSTSAMATGPPGPPRSRTRRQRWPPRTASTTTAEPEKSPNMTRMEFQHVLVTNVQTTNAPVSVEGQDDTGVVRVTGLQYVTLALSPEQSERFVFATEFGPRVAVQRAGHRLRRRHSADHSRQRVWAGDQVMTEINEIPTVTIGHGMSPELAADVSTALQNMGVVVKANGFAPPTRQAKVIVVISPKGGSGKTAVSTNLAIALAQQNPGRVVAVDLDVQFGDLVTALSLTPEHTLAQLARTTQIDATTVKLFLTLHYNGLYVLAGANDPVDADSIARARLGGAAPPGAELRLRGRGHAGGPDERTLAAIECATTFCWCQSRRDQHRSLRKELDALDHRQQGKPATDPQPGRRQGRPQPVRHGGGHRHEDRVLDLSSREIPLSLNLGTPVVIQRAVDGRQAVATAGGALYAPVDAGKARKGVGR